MARPAPRPQPPSSPNSATGTPQPPALTPARPLELSAGVDPRGPLARPGGRWRCLVALGVLRYRAGAVTGRCGGVGALSAPGLGVSSANSLSAARSPRGRPVPPEAGPFPEAPGAGAGGRLALGQLDPPALRAFSSAWWALAVFGGLGGAQVPGRGRNGPLWRCGGALSAGFGGLQRQQPLSGPFPPRGPWGWGWWPARPGGVDPPAPGASGSAWWVLAVWHAGRLVWGMPWPAVARPRPLGPPARPGGSRRRCGVGIGAASVAV